MSALERILKQLQALTPRERRRLLDKLERSLDEVAALAKRRAKAGGAYAHSLSLAGSAHTDFTDVSSTKYAHVADAAADRSDER
jgi:hypothetical protein